MSLPDKNGGELQNAFIDLIENAPLDFMGTGDHDSARDDEAAWDRRVERQRAAISASSAIAPPDSIPMPKAWIEAAKCDNCGGQGWTAVQVEAGVFDQDQCQWCFEKWLALGQPVASTDGGTAT